MLNAIQARMVEESLVDKEHYEAMVALRHSLGELVGTPSPDPGVPELPTPSSAPSRGTKGLPPEVMAVGDPLRDKNRRVQPFIPETAPKPGADPFPNLGVKGAPLG